MTSDDKTPAPHGDDHAHRVVEYQDLQKRRFMALLEACQALSTSLVLDEVMDLICRGVVIAFGLTEIDIYQYSDERDEVTAVWSHMTDDPEAAKAFIGTTYKLVDHPRIRQAFARRGISENHIDDPDLERADPQLFAEMQEWGEKSVVEVGLLFGDEIVGLLSVGCRDRVLRLDEVERELLNAFAATAAIAIHNARLYRTVEDQAIHDGLTGLFNHRYFYERLESEMTRSRRYDAPLSMLMIDVDDFKRFNDRFGHPAGDHVLTRLAGVFSRTLRGDIDVACRYGGEEFAVILPHTSETAVKVAERLRAAIAALHLELADGTDAGSVTVSIGVATVPAAAGDVDGLVSAADEALYAAKQAGKDRVCVHTV